MSSKGSRGVVARVQARGAATKRTASVSNTVSSQYATTTLPKQKLLVLDVNGVTCRKVYDRERVLASTADAYTPSGMALFKRPGVDGMLQAAVSAGWAIVLWSSAVRATVDAIRHALFPSVPVIAILSHENSPTDEHHVRIRAGKNWSIFKDLEILWREPAMNCDETSTIIVDDSWRKIRLQPQNAVLVPSFDVNLETGTVSAEQRDKEVAIMNKLKDVILCADQADDVRTVLADLASVQSTTLGDERGNTTKIASIQI